MVYGQLLKYQNNRLQRVQNPTAGYVINLNWLPIEENIKMNTVKLARRIMAKLPEISFHRT